MNHADLKARIIEVGPDSMVAKADDALELLVRLGLDDAADQIERLEAGRVRMQAEIERRKDEVREARQAPQPVSADAVAGALATINARITQVLNRLGESEFKPAPPASIWRRLFPRLVPARRLAP